MNMYSVYIHNMVYRMCICENVCSVLCILNWAIDESMCIFDDHICDLVCELCVCLVCIWCIYVYVYLMFCVCLRVGLCLCVFNVCDVYMVYVYVWCVYGVCVPILWFCLSEKN